MNELNVGLVDIDSHNFPNLVLMKISAYFKSRGGLRLSFTTR